MTFWGLYQEKRSARYMPPSLEHSNTAGSHSLAHLQRGSGKNGLRPSGHHPAFLIYPFIFIICAAPVTVGSIFYDGENSVMFMAITGPLMALTGFLDTLVWGSTIVFSDEQFIKDTGLDRFAITSESQRRAFGNMVWVSGGAHDAEGTRGRKSKRSVGKGWWTLGGEARSDSRDNIRDTDRGVHVDTETTVVVETESWKGWDEGAVELPRVEALPLRVLSFDNKDRAWDNIYVGVHHG